MKNEERNKIEYTTKAWGIIGWSTLGGLATILVFSLQTNGFAQWTTAFSASILTAGAALAAGGLLGFIFAIPRTLGQERGGPTGNQVENNAPADHEQLTQYQANTNLEQISDWLTKILVGVSLVELDKIPGVLSRFADAFSQEVGNTPGNKVFAVALLVFFITGGFLSSYLWTRLYFAGALRQADLESFGGRLDRLEQQTSLDAHALVLTQHQLNPDPNANPITQADLDKAFKQASSSVKAQIFFQAQTVRRENWRDPQNKNKIERTIPIFHALITADSDSHSPAMHGQLGYALKDKIPPDWKAAREELSKAIELRGSWKRYGYLLYEFNRAICNINLDEKFSNQEKSNPKERDAILADLQAAATEDYSRKLFVSEEAIEKWLKLNELKLTEDKILAANLDGR